MVYSPDSRLHSNIANKLSDELKLKHPDIAITRLSPDETIQLPDRNNGLIIGIGDAGTQSASKNYPKIKKLFIATDPNRYRLDAKKSNATLYMTQSYCRQIKFIRLLNSHWKTISILSSHKKPVNSKPIQQCAKTFGFKIYTVKVSSEENQTNKIKDALKHSNVLLALPDSSIYNSRTVKNILLTSYRYRKPIIGFSKNFVNAGALASIHSTTVQIAHSASDIIEQYFESGARFKKLINYPDEFDININRQVFRALDLPVPDIKTLIESLQAATHSTGESP
jgi:ABC-type uncharacterized transport system substrate-binding protein